MIRRVFPVSRLNHSWLKPAALAFSALLLPASSLAQQPAQSFSTPPSLIVFGPQAKRAEGDHDYRMVVHFSVPADSGGLFVRIFDPDVGGEFDEMQRRTKSATRFSLYGKDAEAKMLRDEEGVLQETVGGEVLASREFGASEELDGQWLDVFEIDANEGAGEGDTREFFLLVEGIAGNDGNVFDVGVADKKDATDSIKGLRLYSFMPTFQMPEDSDELVELRFEVPASAQALTIENFDSAGAKISYAGRFRSAPLEASGKSDWARDRIRLYDNETGITGSVTARSGAESPNDLTIFAGVSEFGPDGTEDGDPVNRPLAIELPARRFAVRERPRIAFEVSPLSCGTMRLDASASQVESGELTLRWRPDADADWLNGAIVEPSYESRGIKKGRLEVDNDSGMVGSGRALDIGFLVKEIPLASFQMPPLVGEEKGGTSVTFDAETSRPSRLPRGNPITSYEWDFGDGETRVQTRADEDFGTPTHIYAEPGIYTITLTVTDDPDHPCNTDITTRTLIVNATPVAEAGDERRAAPREKLVFEAGSQTGGDGDEHVFFWDFGDGTTANTAIAEHAYETPGTYEVMLRVDDGKQAGNSVQEDRISVFVNAAPDGSEVIIPEKLIVGEAGLFDARSASDPDGELTELHWHFGDETKSTKPAVRRVFIEPGTYDIRLELTDDSNLSNASTHVERKLVVEPRPNIPPVAETGGDRQTIVGDRLSFDASQSSDADGSIVNFRWIFGDGAIQEGIRTTHVYREPGTFEARLQVTDDSGKDNETTISRFTVTVAEKPNASPQIAGVADRSAYVNQRIEFDATATQDPDGNLLSFDWDFGDGAKATGEKASHAYGSPGEYDVTLEIRDDSNRAYSDEESALSRDTFTVSVTHAPNPAPTVDIPTERDMQTGVPQVFDASSASDANGLLTRYAWDFGDGSTSKLAVVDHSYAVPGTYQGSLTLTDDSGLENGISVHPFTVNVIERPNLQPLAEAGGDVSTIVGASVTLDGSDSSDNDGSIIRYDWDFGNGKSAVGERRTIAYFAPGTYKVTLKVTDNSAQENATATDTLTVTVADRPNNTPVAVVEPDRPAAIDEPVPFTAAQSGDADGNIISYDWEFGDGATGAGREVVHAYSKSGTYTARLFIRDDSGLDSQSASAERVITVNQPPVADAGPDLHVTASQVVFDASGSNDIDNNIATYEWDFGDGETGSGEKIAHTYRSPGTYTAKLSITDDSGTIRNGDEDERIVRINAMPVADAGFDIVATPGETITFDGSRSIDPDGEIASFLWDFRDGNTAEGELVDHAFEEPGTYTVELTVLDDSGHEEAFDFSQIRVTINDQPIAEAGPDISVAPEQAFTLSAAQSRDNDGTITAQRWDMKTADIVLEGETVEHTLEKPGNYPVTLTVTDDSSAANRTAQDTMTVHVNHAPVAEAGSDQFKGQLRVVLDGRGSADPDGDGLTYRWNLGDGNLAQGPVVEHTYETGGIYPVVLTVDDGRELANSSDTDALTVSLNRAPMAVAGDNRQACVGDVLVFDASSSVDPDNGLLRYSWEFGDGQRSDLINPTKTFEEPGTYRVQLQVIDESGLGNNNHADEALVTVLPAPVANAGPDMEVCSGAQVQFDGTKSTDIDGVVNRYSWDFGDGQAGGGDKPVHVYSAPGTYRVSLQIEGDNRGQCSPNSSDDLVVTALDAPSAVIDAPLNGAVGYEILFDGGKSNVRSGEIAGYQWDFGNGVTMHGEKVSHVFNEPGEYRVRLKAEASADIGGCASAEAIHVIIINDGPIADAGPDRTVEVHQPLQLSAADSVDSDGGIAAYEWNFGDGTTANGVEARHIWREAGEYEVTLTVDDGTELENARHSAKIKVTVTPRPETMIVAEEQACVGERLQFDLANLPADSGAISWSFGDGNINTDNIKSPVHGYVTPGDYTIGVTFEGDRAGNSWQTPIARKILVNHPPEVIIGVQRATCAGTQVTFDASGSYDFDGEVVSMEWDFGDGATAEGAKVTHSFAEPGTYNVRLTVKDSSTTTCGTVEKTFPLFVNAPPVADAGPDLDISIGGAVDSLVLDASRSRDADGDPLNYYWELSNGIEADGEKIRLEYTDTGEVTAKLTATDPHGLACSVATDTIAIKASRREQSRLLAE